MPYRALQCFSCHVMQVKEVRKFSSASSKWCCVLCNEKQSVRKVYSQADTAKEVRNFVQQFNLTVGQAEAAEAQARLEAESTAEDWPHSYSYDEDDEDGQVNEAVGRVVHQASPQRSCKWDKFLPEEEEEQVCSADEFEQSYDSMKCTTTFPEPTSRRRTAPSSSCSPPSKRPLRGFTRGFTSCTDDDADPGTFTPSDAEGTAAYSSPCKPWEFQELDSEGSTPLEHSTWKRPTVPEFTSSSLPASNPACSPEKSKSYHAQVSGGQTSKWSKYLT